MSSIANGKDVMMLPADYYRLDEMFRDKAIANFGTKTITEMGATIPTSYGEIPEQNIEITMPYQDCIYASLSIAVNIAQANGGGSQLANTCRFDRIKGFLQIDDVIKEFDEENVDLSLPQASNSYHNESIIYLSLNEDNILKTLKVASSDTNRRKIMYYNYPSQYKKVNNIKLHIESTSGALNGNLKESTKLVLTYGQPFKI